MLAKLFKIKPISPHQSQGETLYQKIVEQARTPLFYTQTQVSNDPRGRFELIALHLFIVLRCLKEKSHTQNLQEFPQEISQILCNLFVADMNHSLRDLRISESTVDRQFKKFVEGFYGRLISYDLAYETDKEGLFNIFPLKLVEAFIKNIYNGDKTNEQYAKDWVTYVLSQLDFLRNLPLSNLHFKPGILK